MVCPEELNGTEFDKGSVRDGGDRGAGGERDTGAQRGRGPQLWVPPSRSEDEAGVGVINTGVARSSLQAPLIDETQLAARGPGSLWEAQVSWWAQGPEKGPKAAVTITRSLGCDLPGPAAVT